MWKGPRGMPRCSGGAVSRILSSPPRQGRGSFVSAADTRRPPAEAGLERAVPRRPIWPCSRGGFPCPGAHATGGGLLPRLFTLAATLAGPGGLFSVALSVVTRFGAPLPRVSPAVPGLRGPEPCGVRTFLPQQRRERPSAPPEHGRAYRDRPVPQADSRGGPLPRTRRTGGAASASPREDTRPAASPRAVSTMKWARASGNGV